MKAMLGLAQNRAARPHGFPIDVFPNLSADPAMVETGFIPAESLDIYGITLDK